MRLAVNLIALAGLILAGFFALTLHRAGKAEARAEATFPPQGELIDVNGHRMHAVIRGSGPDLVLIHGASGNLRDFTLQIMDRVSDRYRVIAIDRPGFGYSDPLDGGGTLSDQARLLADTAAALGAERPVVVGHSYGGAVALAWAVQHPDRIAALVPLAAVSNPWSSGLDRFYRVTSHPALGPLTIPLITAWTSPEQVTRAIGEAFDPQAPPDGYAAHFGPGLSLRRISLRANALQRAALKAQIIAQFESYAGITVPTEIVHGTADTIVGLQTHSEPLARQIPGAVLTPLPGIGHMPQHNGSQDAVIAAIDRAASRAGLH